MNAKHYVGDIIGGSLFVAESRVVAELLLDELSDEDFRFVIEEDNVLQKRSAHTAIRYARTIRLRLEPLGTEFLKFLVSANETCAKQLLMAAFLIQSPAALDFMTHVVADARRDFAEKLTEFSWTDFIDERIRVIPDLGRFSESSIKKMGNNMMKALADAGYLNSTRQKKLQAVYLDPDVNAWLIENRYDKVAKAMEI